MRHRPSMVAALVLLSAGCAPGAYDAPPGELTQAVQCGILQWWNSGFTWCGAGHMDPQGSCSYQDYNPHDGTTYWWDTDLAVGSSTQIQLRHDSRLVDQGTFAWGWQPTFDDLATGKRFSFLHLRPQNRNTTSIGTVYPSGTIVGLSGGDTADTGYSTYSSGPHLCVQSVDYYRNTVGPAGTDACGPICTAPPATAEAAIRRELPFDCGNSLVFYTSDWSGGSYKAECGNYQAMTGLSVSPSTGGAHAALCYNDDQAFFPHSYPTTCHAVVFNAGNAGYTGASGDWDSGYYKGECAANEFVAGVSQTPSLQMSAILCCTGRVDHSAPAALVMAMGEAREGGTASTTGDWSGGYYKGECGPGRYVCGASQDPGQHKPHAILCCGTQTATGPALLSQTAAVDALTFDSQNQQRPPGASDFSPGMFKAECGSSQALTGLSASSATAWAHSALCNASDPSFTHQSCHAVVFNAGNAGYTGAHGDWDPTYYKGECGANEYIAGASQTTDTHGLTAILCCAGNLAIDYPTCAALSVSGKNTIEAGATTGDWAAWYYKAECGPGRFAVGASQDPTSHNPHSILCCNPAATPDFGSMRPDLGSTSTSTDLGSTSTSTDLAGAPVPDGALARGADLAPPTTSDAGLIPSVTGGCSCGFGSSAPSGLPLVAGALLLLLVRLVRRRANRGVCV